MDVSECEMETSNKTSEYTTNTISSSWVLLDSDESSSRTGHGQSKENIERTTNEPGDSSCENVSDITNNKSDTESDGISIISESEFFNGRSDDDSSINSFDENTSDNSKLLEGHDIEQKELQKLLETPNEKESKLKTITDINNMTHQTKMPKEITTVKERSPKFCPLNKNDMTNQVKFSSGNTLLSDNVSPSTDENFDMTQQSISMTSFNDPRRSSDLSEKIFDKERKHDMVFAPFNIICLASPILFALLAYSIPSKTNEENSFNPENLGKNDQNIFQNCNTSQIYEFCQYIYESTEQRKDYKVERCLKKVMKGMKKYKKFEYQTIPTGRTIKSSYHDFDSPKVDIDFNKNDKKKRLKKEYIEYDFTFEKPKKNTKLEKYKRSNSTTGKIQRNEILQEPFRYNKKIKHYKQKTSTKDSSKEAFDTKNKYIKEKGIAHSWIKKLAKKEKRLRKWEKDLVQREKKLYERNKNSPFRAHNVKKTDFSHANKIKLDRSKNKDKAKNNEKFKFNRSYKKNSKNHRSPKVQEKYDHHIPVKELRNSELPYIQRKNLSNADEITGEWYINLIQSRSHIRKRNKIADWWFERANFRKHKRNKAYWYFQYMFNRADLRYNDNISVNV